MSYCVENALAQGSCKHTICEQRMTNGKCTLVEEHLEGTFIESPLILRYQVLKLRSLLKQYQDRANRELKELGISDIEYVTSSKLGSHWENDQGLATFDQDNQ